MAQTVEQGGAAKKATTPTAQTPAPKGITREVFQTRLKSFFSPPPARAGATGAQGRSKPGGMMKMMFGMLAFMVAAEFITLPLGVVDQKLNLGLTRLVVVPAGVPLLGGMTAFVLIYLLAILGLWIVLLKFNIIPRDPFGMKAAQRTRTQQTAATTATRRPGGPRTRAERRHDATTAVTTKETGKSASKSASGARNTAATPTRTGVAVAGAGAAHAATRTGQPGKHDDAYERARTAAQKRRRAARR